MEESDLSILIVDDNPDDAYFLRKNLADTKYRNSEIAVAGTIKDAVGLLDTNSFDVIFLDRILPDVRDFDLDGLRQLRVSPGIETVRAIIMNSAKRYSHRVGDMIQQGASDYLKKGEYDATLLEKTIFVALERNDFLVQEIDQKFRLGLHQAHELEKEKIAKDLHDGILQTMVGIHFSLSAIQGDAFGNLPPYAKQYLEDVKQVLADNIADFRAYTHSLSTSIISRWGLVEGTQKLIKQAKRANGGEIRFSYDRDHYSMSQETKNHIFLVAQEFLSNALKHAEASIIEVAFRQFGGEFILKCRDNGKGFDYPTARKEGQGLGLISLEDRLELIAQKYLISSQLGTGTKLHAIIPLNPICN